MRNIILGQEEVYTANPNVWSFKRVRDIANGINLRLSNMAGDFPFEFNGTKWADIERLYLCGEFSDYTIKHRVIQQELLDSKSGYAAQERAHQRCAAVRSRWVADQISDTQFDAFLEKGPNTRAGIEVMAKDNIVVLGGEVKSTAQIERWARHTKHTNIR